MNTLNACKGIRDSSLVCSIFIVPVCTLNCMYCRNPTSGSCRAVRRVGEALTPSEGGWGDAKYTVCTHSQQQLSSV